MYIQFQFNTEPDFNESFRDVAEDIIDHLIENSVAGLSVDDYEISDNEDEVKISFKEKDRKDEVFKFDTADELIANLSRIFGFDSVAGMLLEQVNVQSIKVRTYKDKAELDKAKKTSTFWT